MSIEGQYHIQCHCFVVRPFPTDDPYNVHIATVMIIWKHLEIVLSNFIESFLLRISIERAL